MSELLLEKKLRESAVEDEVRKIARIRTLTVCRALDAEQRGSVFRLLYESGLIDKDKCIIDLSGPNLGGADLSNANLRNANLRGVKLWRAFLFMAALREALLIGVAQEIKPKV